jgi:transposase
MYRPAVGAHQSFTELDFEAIHKQLCRKGVTLQLLWQEYRLAHPENGYQYSQFCELYRRWKKPLSAVLGQQHKAGEKVFVYPFDESR